VAALDRRVVGFLGIAVLLAGGCTSGGSAARGTSPTPSPSISLIPTPTPSLIIHVPPIPDGVYESTITRDDARRLGFLGCDPQDVPENTGHVVMTLRNGRFRSVLSANHPIFNPVNTGVYTGTRTVVTFISNPNTADEGTTSARWRFDGKYLYFKVLKATDSEGRDIPLCIARLGFEAHPWLKTG
jgi:hypothetical protein